MPSPSASNDHFTTWTVHQKRCIALCTKTRGLVNLLSHKCQESGCRIQPIYNFVNSTRGFYCNTHKHKAMVDVRTIRCAHLDCRKISPNFNVIGARGGFYCFDHKLQGMVDVVRKFCEEVDCQTRASCGLVGSSNSSFCAVHKKPGMVTSYTVNNDVLQIVK